MSLLQLKNLSLGYGEHTVIKNLSLKIEAGDFVCIVGPNGAGKSTLVQALLGLIKPRSGTIKYGLDRRLIGYMPQETQVDANFPASVFEIVLSGTLNQTGMRPFYRMSEKNRALDALETLKITDLKDRNFRDLSGGQRQKVLLARSLAATAKLLILDEPSNNLDRRSKSSFYQTLTELNRNQGITILMVTHDLDHDNLIGNQILSLREDDVFFGKTADFYRKVHHE